MHSNLSYMSCKLLYLLYSINHSKYLNICKNLPKKAAYIIADSGTIDTLYITDALFIICALLQDRYVDLSHGAHLTI